MSTITDKLFLAKDLKFRGFNKKIVPDTNYEMIGVKLPEIRKIVNSVSSFSDALAFFGEKHAYYEEIMAHGLLIAKFCDEKTAYPYLDGFLPLIDNWAVCDTVATSLKKLAKNKDLLWQKVCSWLKSDRIYTVRFAVVCLLAHFSDKSYTDKVIGAVLTVKTGEYYIDMAIAWLISVVLVKDYDKAVALLNSKTLPRFIQNKSIDKARDSFRIDKDKKVYLKSLKI